MQRSLIALVPLVMACGSASGAAGPDPARPATSGPTPTVLRVEELGRLPRAEPEISPEGVSRWATSSGWGGTYFVARHEAGRVDVVTDGGTTELVRGFDHPRALLLDGGRLVVADEHGIHAIALASRESTPIAALPGIVSLTLDHEGYWVAGRASAPPVRVTPEGETTVLEGVMPGPVDFDPASRELLVVDESERRVHVYDYVRVVGEDPAVWADRDARPMRPFTIGDVGLTSAEYWPNRGDTQTRYPEDVLWGFYPERGVVFEGAPSPASATPAAVACAEESYRALHAFLSDPPDTLGQAIGLGTSNRFYLWVNDYSEASDPFPHELRPNRFWYWRRDPPVVGRIPGYWKWETTLTQSGECLIPERAQALEYLDEKIEELRGDTP